MEAPPQIGVAIIKAQQPIGFDADLRPKQAAALPLPAARCQSQVISATIQAGARLILDAAERHVGKEMEPHCVAAIFMLLLLVVLLGRARRRTHRCATHLRAEAHVQAARKHIHGLREDASADMHTILRGKTSAKWSAALCAGASPA